MVKFISGNIVFQGGIEEIRLDYVSLTLTSCNEVDNICNKDMSMVGWSIFWRVDVIMS